MSRSGYNEDYDCDDDGNLAMGRWRGMIASASRGKRGQKFFADLAEALDAMPVKELIADALVSGDRVCAIGALGVKRGFDMADLDPEDPDTIGATFGIASCLARETVFMNDEAGSGSETPEQRWNRVRSWVGAQKIAPRPLPADIAS